MRRSDRGRGTEMVGETIDTPLGTTLEELLYNIYIVFGVTEISVQ
jgi:hypothetical protein